MAPNAGGEPTGELSQMIQDTFGSFSEFKQQFTQAGMTRFDQVGVVSSNQ